MLGRNACELPCIRAGNQYVSGRTAIRAQAIGATVLLALSACATNVVPSQPSRTAATPQAIKPGGRIYVLTQSEEWDQVDPQRIFTPQELAFFGGTMYRSLEAFTFSPDPKVAATLTPDLATDLGRHNASFTQWQFTLRDGVAWQDGSQITCADIKYGVSRTFATDVINQGPAYAIEFLDIPYEADGQTSRYKGPYKRTGQGFFDKAVTCDGKTITFNLNEPVPDFNYAVTLGFFPVPKDVDSGATYGEPGHLAMASGPYKVASFTTGKGGRMVLVRNQNWNPASDPYRKAYPDSWEVDFALDPHAIDARLIRSTGKDATSVQSGQIQSKDLGKIFTDPARSLPEFGGRVVSAFDGSVRYLWVNVAKVPDVTIRRAMWVALDRAALREALGGAFTEAFADGVIPPNIGQDYASTGLLDGSLKWLGGRIIPDGGDPALAKQLLAGAMPNALRLGFLFDAMSPSESRVAQIVKSSLARAGFVVSLIGYGSYYDPRLTPGNYEFGMGGWRADWPSASTIIPVLFTTKGGLDLSQLNDPALNERIEEARAESDRLKQAADWQALDKDAVDNMYVLPTFFDRTQSLAGTKIGPIFSWPARNTWPFGAMYVKQ